MRSLTIVFSLLATSAFSQCNSTVIWSNTTTNAVCSEVNGVLRYWYANSIPNHATGTFPNANNPNSISAQQTDLTMCAYPQEAGQFTDLIISGFGTQGGCPTFEFGIATNGLEFDPIAAEFFSNPNNGQLNYSWNKNPLSPLVNLGTDMNDAHVQPTGKYHYHGDPVNFIATLNVSAAQHSPIIGYAADGFPLYYKYVYADAMDANSGIVEATTCYQLRSGTRPGNGTTAPNGAYDGTYVEDYEYNGSLGGCILDECSGRYGVTPDFPNGTYYYVMTAEFPVIPRCFAGTPDMSFSIGPPFAGCGVSDGASFCSALTVGVSTAELAENVVIYPVPSTSESVNLMINGLENLHPVQVSIVDELGRTLRTEPYNQYIPIGDLPRGIYFIQFTFENTEITKRFVKQ